MSGAIESEDVDIHEHVIVRGETSWLRSEMDHYAFPTVAAFVEKHNCSSNWEAHAAVDGLHVGVQRGDACGFHGEGG